VTVIANRVGAINQARLVNSALSNLKLSETIVLMGQKDSAREVEQTNRELISEFTNQPTISIPFLGATASEVQTIHAAVPDLAEQLQTIVNALRREPRH
jgi:dethiobiotin synthetase